MRRLFRISLAIVFIAGALGMIGYVAAQPAFADSGNNGNMAGCEEI
jgi:hypothetical protein